MRILIVAGAIEGGGAEHQLNLLCTGLLELGHLPRVVTLRKPSFETRYPVVSPGRSGRGRLVSLERIFAAASITRSIVRDWNPDALVCWLAIPTLLGAFTCPSHRMVRIAAIRNSTPESMRLLPTGLQKWLMRRALERIDLVVANSAAGIRHYTDDRLLGQQPRTVIPNCRESGHFRPPTPDERDDARAALGGGQAVPTVLYVGRIAPEKNLALLAEAIVQLSRKLPHCCVLLAGLDATQWDSIKGSSDTGTLMVIPLGHVRDIRKAYWAADVLVLTSSREGSPNAVHEARTCGLPVVSTPCGDVPDTATDVDDLVVPEPDAMAAALFARLSTPVPRVARGNTILPSDCAQHWVHAITQIQASQLIDP